MGYTHDHDTRPSGSLHVATDIHAHLRLAHDIGNPENLTKDSAYALHDCLDTHVPWDQNEFKREAIDMPRGKKTKKARKGKDRWASSSVWSSSPKHVAVRKSVADALSDIVTFQRRKTWQELRAEKGTYLIKVTHTMLVEVTDDFDVVCFAADNKGAMPTPADDVDRPEQQLEFCFVSDFNFDHLEKQDRPRIVDEKFVFADVESPEKKTLPGPFVLTDVK